MNKQYELNRKKVIDAIEDNSVITLFSGVNQKSSADGEFPFVVNRNFYHLTGINEPNLILVLTKDDSILYIEESDEFFEKWVGKKISKEAAKAQSNIDNIQYVSEFDPAQLADFDNKYFDLEEDTISFNKTISQKFVEEHNINAIDVYNIIAKSRSTKGSAEVTKIREALEITNKGLNRIMDNLQPNMRESVLEAHFNFELGCENVINAFDTIAASGVNATTLHYVTNNEFTQDGDLILFDLGATKDLYCGDISRTYPVSGKFTPRQKELYDMVLEALELVIANIKPGVTMTDLNDLVNKHYEKELVRLNVIEDKYQVKDYYYHGVSHSLGLDTHDVGLSREDKLVVGNVITVEPGIYIKEENIGIRIEDNVLVTEDGCINLSDFIIKTTEDIERYMNNGEEA